MGLGPSPAPLASEVLDPPQVGTLVVSCSRPALTSISHPALIFQVTGCRPCLKSPDLPMACPL